MSKLRCSCGYVISDATTPSDTEGHLVRNRDENAVLWEAAVKIARFCAAVKSGTRAEWLARGMEYAQHLADEDVIYDILSSCWLERLLRVSECSGCGRLWIQEQPGLNQYIAFSPDGGGMQDMLKSPFPRLHVDDDASEQASSR